MYKALRRIRSDNRKQALKTRFYIDWLFLGLCLALILFGVLMVFDASVVDAYLTYDDKFHYARLQLMWVGIGLLGMVSAFLVPIDLVRKLAKPLFLFSMALLVLVLIPGIGTKVAGAQRWLNIGGFSLQPSELAKLAVGIYFSSWLALKQELKPFISLVGVILVLLMLQPDMGTSIVIVSIALSLYYLSGASLKQMIPIISIGLLVGLVLILSSPYRRERLQTFLDPSVDPLGSSYHVRQVVISLGSGGWYGTGVGRSRQKYQYLPEATTDSIFAVIAEEMGFLGASVVVTLYFLIILRGLSTANKIKDPFTKLLAASIVVWFATQTILNLSAMVVLVPLTGIPLPLVSYGGSSLITIMTGIGLYLNAAKGIDSSR